jgi:hypothetical protein
MCSSNVIAKFGFECRFHDLKNILKLNFLLYSLSSNIDLRATLQNSIEKHQFYLINHIL